MTPPYLFFARFPVGEWPHLFYIQRTRSQIRTLFDSLHELVGGCGCLC